MSFNLSSIPSNAICLICSFLDEKSLLRIREVCKSFKDTIDVLPCTQQTSIDNLDITEKNDEMLTLFFYFKKEKHWSLWKIFIVSALSKLGIQKSNLKQSQNSIRVSLPPEEALKLVGHMKQLLKGRQFCSKLTLRDSRYSTLNIITDFLEEQTLSQMAVEFAQDSGSIKIPHLQNIIQILRPNYLMLIYFLRTNEFLEFLLQVANFAEVIAIGELRSPDSEMANYQLFPPSAISQILSLKCNRLYLGDYYYPFSISDVEKLVQVLHHGNQKVAFFVNTDIAQMNTQIGAYTVTFTDMIRIMHRDLL